MDKREVLAFTRQFLDSPAFPHLFYLIYRPSLQTWAYRLLNDMDLTFEERRGIILAMQELHAGFVRSYEECGIEVPEWLDKEFFRGNVPQ